jgi:Icc protein
MRSLALIALVACTHPAEERAKEELAVGTAATNGVTVEVVDGLAAIRELAGNRLELWCTAPDVTVNLTLDASAAGTWTIVARNSLADAVLGTPAIVFRDPGERPTVATFQVSLDAGTHALRIAPMDADVVGPFRVAAMADIQTALPEVDQVFRAISEAPDARFVIAMGDITERGREDEYALFETQLLTLDIPFYSTIGNHELWGPPARYFDAYGRASFHFRFKGIAFSFADSGDAGIDPLVETQLAGWIERARDRTHVFLTHIPPIDPLGARTGAFRSARDGHRLLAMLAEGGVDLTLYGHIHTFVEYENAGIPAFISGGGGAAPMLGDGIDRHFLVIDFDDAVQSVLVQRVD